jgi:zinc/manganese transport system substrate-binding protein
MARILFNSYYCGDYMRKILLSIAAVLLLSAPSYPRINVVTTYPYLADIAKHVGKDKISVAALARGDYNPHVIIPKPSFIAKVRNADLLIINGAQLEIGWLPPIMRQANNADVQPGENGFLDISVFIKLIEIPSSISRDQGDVHPEGNPHFYLDPENIPLIASAITDRLCKIDPANAPEYTANNKEFAELWNRKYVKWKEDMKPLQGARVIEYHKVFDYFLLRFGIQIAGTVEPLPGIPPTTRHIGEIEKIIKNEKIAFLLQDVYNPRDASIHLSDKMGIKMVIIPHDVDAVDEARDIFSLFDEIVGRLIK